MKPTWTVHLSKQGDNREHLGKKTRKLFNNLEVDIKAEGALAPRTLAMFLTCKVALLGAHAYRRWQP